MILFGILMAIDLLVAAGVVGFFLWGLSDGSVSSFNLGLWILLLTLAVGLPWGGWELRRHGRKALGNLVLLLPALPAIIAVVIVVVLLMDPPDWR